MKRFALTAALLVTCLVTGMAQAQEPAAAATGPETLTLQQQIDELRSRLQELEAQLQKTQETQEATSRDLYAATEAQKKLAQGEKVKLSGYIQTQFTNDRAASPETDFRVRRGRLKLAAQVTDLAALTLQIDAARTVDLKDAYLDLGRTTDLYRFRMGQALVPFLYEVLESDATALAPERTAMSTTLFPSERDIGAWVNFKNVLGDQVPGTTLDLGAMSGNGPSAADNNNSKDVIARLRFVTGKKPADKDTEADTVYVAYQKGDFTDSKGNIRDKQFLGGGLSQAFGPLWLRAEAIRGKYLGKDILGYYALAAYRFKQVPGALFARYDVYNEDRDRADAKFKNLVVGYQHQLDANTRVVVSHEFRDPDAGYSKFSKTDGDVTTVRLQVKY